MTAASAIATSIVSAVIDRLASSRAIGVRAGRARGADPAGRPTYFFILSLDMVSFDILSLDMVSFDIVSLLIVSFFMVSLDMLSFDIVSFFMSSAANAGAPARLSDMIAADRAIAIRDGVISELLLRTFPMGMLLPIVVSSREAPCGLHPGVKNSAPAAAR